MDERFLVAHVGWGWCGLRRTGAGLSRCTVPQAERDAAAAMVAAGATPGEGDPLLGEVAAALRTYFGGSTTEFGVEMDLGGLSDFTRRVLVACTAVPYGSTESYGGLAAAVGSPRAARAVGQALHRNPLAIVVPCHRIVDADGGLGGFGSGLKMKRRLLDLEGIGRRRDDES